MTEKQTINRVEADIPADEDILNKPQVQPAGRGQHGDEQRSRLARPLLLKLLALLFLILSWFGWMRLYGTLTDWSLLDDYLSQSMLVYIAAGGAVWGLAGLVSAAALWFGITIASWFSRATAVTFFAWYWLDQMFLTRSSLEGQVRLFELTASTLLFLFALLVPALAHVKHFFREVSLNHEEF